MSTPTTAPLTTTDTSVVTDEDTTSETDPGEVAHIVKVGPGEDAAAKVLEARVTGTPVEALCGYVWVPAKDPRRLPVCEACKQIYELYRGVNDGLSETPRI